MPLRVLLDLLVDDEAHLSTREPPMIAHHLPLAGQDAKREVLSMEIQAGVIHKSLRRVVARHTVGLRKDARPSNVRLPRRLSSFIRSG